MDMKKMTKEEMIKADAITITLGELKKASCVLFATSVCQDKDSFASADAGNHWVQQLYYLLSHEESRATIAETASHFEEAFDNAQENDSNN